MSHSGAGCYRGSRDTKSSTLLEVDPEPWTLSPRLQELAPQACARLAEAWSLAEPQSVRREEDSGGEGVGCLFRLVD